MVNSRNIKLGATQVENGIVNVSLSVLVNVNGEENKLMFSDQKSGTLILSVNILSVYVSLDMAMLSFTAGYRITNHLIGAN